MKWRAKCNVGTDLHGLDHADVAGLERVQRVQRRLQRRQRHRQVALALVLDRFGRLRRSVGHRLVCTHHLHIKRSTHQSRLH